MKTLRGITRLLRMALPLSATALLAACATPGYYGGYGSVYSSSYGGYANPYDYGYYSPYYGYGAAGYSGYYSPVYRSTYGSVYRGGDHDRHYVNRNHQRWDGHHDDAHEHGPGGHWQDTSGHHGSGRPGEHGGLHSVNSRQGFNRGPVHHAIQHATHYHPSAARHFSGGGHRDRHR